MPEFIFRPYQDEQDLRAMQALLRAIKQQRPYSTMHPGDIEWWFYYNPSGDTMHEAIFLWHTPTGDLAAWASCVAAFGEYDYFVHPQQHSEALERQIIRTMERHLAYRFSPDVLAYEVGSVFADDAPRRALLEQLGYHGTDNLVLFSRPLDAPLPAPALPAGYRFLAAMRPEYAAQRAAVHFSAFTPSRMTADYYRGFMRAPSYQAAHDVVCVAPDGTFAAFAMSWTDAELGVGEFEPVGTHQAHQRRGLGRAVLYEGMRRLQAAGMHSVTVCCDAHKPNNIAFYEAVGFVQRNRILRYSRPLAGT